MRKFTVAVGMAGMAIVGASLWGWFAPARPAPGSGPQSITEQRALAGDPGASVPNLETGSPTPPAAATNPTAGPDPDAFGPLKYTPPMDPASVSARSDKTDVICREAEPCGP
jgi:hypothetical protein